MRSIGVVLAAALALIGCGDTTARVADESGLHYPGARLMREVPSSDAEVYNPPDAANSCATSIASYVSDDRPEDVTAFFERSGFVPRGESGRSAHGYRWLGVRDGDETTWRRVDIADGQTAGHPDWETAFEVLAPACDSEAESGAGIAPTRSG